MDFLFSISLFFKKVEPKVQGWFKANSNLPHGEKNQLKKLGMIWDVNSSRMEEPNANEKKQTIGLLHGHYCNAKSFRRCMKANFGLGHQF